MLGDPAFDIATTLIRSRGGRGSGSRGSGGGVDKHLALDQMQLLPPCI